MRNWLRTIQICLLVTQLTLSPWIVRAQASSANYQVQSDSLNAGGDVQGSSTNYQVFDATGEIQGNGTLSSTNYGITDGFIKAQDVLTINSVYMSISANGLSDAYPAGTMNDLTPGGSITRHLNGVVQDEGGRDAINTVSAVYYRSGVSGAEACSQDSANCLRVASCTLGNNADADQKTYDCSISIPYYADATDAGSAFAAQQWVAYIEMTDGETTVSDSSTTKEMGTLLALDIPTTILFGSHALGNETVAADNANYTVTQQGNSVVDVEVSMGSDMTCTTGTIPKGNIQWSLTDVDYGAVGTTAITATPADTNTGVARQTTGTPTTGLLYWNLRTPSSGVGGSCSGTTTITSIAG